MIDSVTTDQDPDSPPREVPADNGERPSESLVQRVQRLEDAVAALQDTRPIEDRVVERVTERLTHRPAAAPTPEAAPAPQTPVEHMVTAERRAYPPPAGVDSFPHVEPAAPAGPATFTDEAKRPWLLFDVYSEMRTMLRMY